MLFLLSFVLGIVLLAHRVPHAEALQCHIKVPSIEPLHRHFRSGTLCRSAEQDTQLKMMVVGHVQRCSWHCNLSLSNTAAP